MTASAPPPPTLARTRRLGMVAVPAQGNPSARGSFRRRSFSTMRAAMSGKFGWPGGSVAGAVHQPAAQTVGMLHGGLNLCNDGFAAGIVAAIPAPAPLSLSPSAAAPSGDRL